MSGGATSLLNGCHSPVGGRVCSAVIGVESLRVRFDKAPLPLSACSFPKEVSTEASEARVVINKLMNHPCRHLQFCPEAAEYCVTFSVVFVPDLVLGWCWESGHYGCRN